MTLLRMMMIANLHEIAEVLDIGPLRINQLHNHLPQLLRVCQLPVGDHLDDHTHDQPMNHVVINLRIMWMTKFMIIWVINLWIRWMINSFIMWMINLMIMWIIST